MSIIALIPARGGSKRLPRKNLLLIDGRPMLSYPIETALNSRLFDQVCVSTEDDEISRKAVMAGASVIRRPLELAQDRSTVIEVCLHALSVIPQVDIICCIYATAFLLKPESIVNSFKLLNKSPKADFVMGVSEYPFAPVQALHTDDNGFLHHMWPEWRGVQSQFYPTLVVSNGTFYWASSESLRREKSFYGEKLKGYLLEYDEVSDINTQDDLDKAIRLFKARK